jgi:ribonuclease HI
VPDGAFATGHEPDSTNQRMEVAAALDAVRSLPGVLLVISDSEYVVKCHRDRWYVKWEKKGWKNAKGKPVANQDLWKPMVELFHARGDELSFQWVKGHSGDVMNDVVDRLAVEAARTQTGRHGDAPPTGLGEPDEPVPAGAARRGAGDGLPPGYRVMVLGPRPPGLGGYGDNPVAAGVRRKLVEILTGLRTVHPDLVVLTGLGLGAEQLGADAAVDAGVPYGAVLAFPDPDDVWPAESKSRFRRLVDGAVGVKVVAPGKPTTKQAAGIAIGRRDDWLAGRADGAIVVWDGADRAIGDRVRSFERRIPDELWIVTPEG